MNFVKAFWDTYLEMAPYLIIGLLVGGLLHIFFKKDFIEKHLGKPGFLSVVKSSLLGVPLPLCSCGVVPAAMSLKEHKATNGSVVSFLISTPQTGVDSIAATYGMMGPFMAVFRPFAAFVMGIFGGVVTDALDKDSELQESKPVVSCASTPVDETTLLGKIKSMVNYAFVELLDGITLNLIIGIAIAAVITSLGLSSDFLNNYVGNQWLEMLLMVVVGVPLYVCSTGSIPIALSLVAIGLSPGAAFVFLAVGPATNAATITVINGKLGKKITIIYLLTMIVAAMAAGFLLNLWGGELATGEIMSCHEEMGAHSGLSWKTVFAYIFLIPLLWSIYRIYLAMPLMKLRKRFEAGGVNDTAVFTVNGMSCGNCARHVSTAAMSVKGIVDAEVNLEGKSLTVKGKIDREAVKKAVTDAGYEILD